MTSPVDNLEVQISEAEHELRRTMRLFMLREMLQSAELTEFEFDKLKNVIRGVLEEGITRNLLNSLDKIANNLDDNFSLLNNSWSLSRAEVNKRFVEIDGRLVAIENDLATRNVSVGQTTLSELNSNLSQVWSATLKLASRTGEELIRSLDEAIARTPSANQLPDVASHKPGLLHQVQALQELVARKVANDAQAAVDRPSLPADEGQAIVPEPDSVRPPPRKSTDAGRRKRSDGRTTAFIALPAVVMLVLWLIVALKLGRQQDHQTSTKPTDSQQIATLQSKLAQLRTGMPALKAGLDASDTVDTVDGQLARDANQLKKEIGDLERKLEMLSDKIALATLPIKYRQTIDKISIITVDNLNQEFVADQLLEANLLERRDQLLTGRAQLAALQRQDGMIAEIVQEKIKRWNDASSILDADTRRSVRVLTARVSAAEKPAKDVPNAVQNLADLQSINRELDQMGAAPAAPPPKTPAPKRSGPKGAPPAAKALTQESRQ